MSDTPDTTISREELEVALDWLRERAEKEERPSKRICIMAALDSIRQIIYIYHGDAPVLPKQWVMEQVREFVAIADAFYSESKGA